MTQSYNPFDDEGDVLIQEQEVVQADNPFDDVVIESTPPDLPIQAVSYNPFDDLDEGNEIDETGVVVSEEPTNPFDDLDEGNEIDETGVVVSEEPTIARKVAYGASQEPMILGSVGRLVETAYETVFEGKDWEEARADTEAERQEEIFEDFPEFKGGKYDDDGEVIVGKVATAIADPVTYLVPWVKAAKAGKLVLGATGAMTASGEYALHSYALTGEVDPKMLSIVAGSGGTLAVGGDIFIKFLSKRYSKGLTEEQIINKVERRIIKGRDDINDLTAKEQQVITDSFKLASVKDFYGQLKHIDNNTKHLVALKELRASRKAGTITEEVFQTTKTKLNAVLDRKFADMTDMRTAAQVEIAELLYKNKSFSTKAFEVAIRPMFGTLMLGGAGIALDADDSQLYTLMAIGFGSGALSRKLKYNTFLPQKVKQDIMKSVFKRNVAFTLRNIDVNFSATLATKGKALGAETGQFSDMMFHQFKSKGARQLSVEERSTMAYNHWMMTLYDDVIKKSTKKTQTSAVKILRGYDKDSDNTSEALELAGRFRDFFDDYRMYHTDVDIHAVTELDHYFPREYNFDIINKNGKAFKDVLAFIYGKQNPKLTPEKAQKAANGFIKNFYLNSNAPVSEINKQGRQVLDTLPFIKHLQKERELHGTIDIDGIPTQIEELLEPWLKNDPTEILSNMIKESTKTVEFARTWGAKGELLRRLRKKIHDKYAGTAEDKRLYKEHNREIKYINDSINAYFGRYGISDWGGHNAAGSIAMYNNLAMLEDVTLANLGDLIQPFQNSTFFKSAIKGIKITSATKTKTALNSKEPARYLAIGPTNQLQDEIQELSGITNNAAKIISKTNQGFFKMIGLQNITSYARRFAYNTGAIDAFETAKKWTKLNNKNIRAIEKKTGKKWSEFTKEEHIKLIVGSKLTKQTEILRKRLGYAGISTKQAKTLSTFDNFDEAFKSDYKYLLNSAGFRAMERDAKIPTVGNRLLYTQSKNPWLKLVGQFASWAQAKTAQVNSLVSRMEDGEAKLAVKMAGLLSIYGGVKTLREVIADGELSNESKDWAKFLADANQLSGNVGFFGNLASQQYINKYGNDPLNFFPAASTLSKGAEAVRSIDITDPLALTPEIKKILPMPKTINILERTFGREVFEEPSIYKEREYEESKGYSVGGLVSQAERLGFNKGGEVSLDNTSNNSIGIGEQQRLEDYSNTSDNLLPITEGNVVEEPSMWDNISTDYDKRLKSMDESRKDRESREISLVRSTVNTAGAIAGLGFDVAGAVIEESVSTYLDNLKSFAPSTYADTSEKVTEAKDWALNTEAGQVAVAAAQKGYEEYSIWKKDNPQDAKTFEAVLNIGMFGWGAKGIASQMLKRKKPEVLPPINQTKIPPLLVDKTKQGLKVYSDKNASFLNVKKIDDSMVVTNVNVDPTLRRRGVALSMYEEAVKDATTRGVNLTSDMTVKLSAIGVYKKLEALGYDVSFNKNTTDVVNDYGVITRFSTDDLPVVTVHTKKPKAAMPAKKTKEVRDNEFKELAKGLTESGGFKYKLPTMLLDLALKDKVGLSKPKQWKYSLSQWAKKGKIKQEELDDSMLMKWLDTIDVDGKLSTKDIFNFMRDNSPMLKTYTSKIQSKVDTEWLDKQPLQQEKIKLQDNAHNKFQEVIYLRDLSNITDISSDNKKLVKTTAEMMHHAIVENIINYMHSPSFIDNQLMDFLTNSPYTLKAIQRKAVDANLLNKPNSIFHPDHQQLDNKEYIREAAVELVSEVTPDKRNSYIVGAIIEDLNQAYLKAEGREKEVLSKYVNIFMDSYKAKIKQIRFGIENVTELRKLSEEALRRNAGDVNPSTWSSFSLPNMKGKPVTILVQSKVGTDDRLKKLRDFRAEVSEHSKGPYIGHSSELSITGLTTKLNDPTTLPLSAKERIETVRKLKRSKQTFKEKTGVTWEDRQTYLDNLEGNIYTEEHWTGTYGESPLKKGIPQENIIISIRGNVIEQGSLGESRGLFISEQQAQPHQTAMANKKQLDVLGNNLFKNITGYSALDSGAKIKELQRKLKSSEARNKAISGKYRKLQKDYSERYEELEGQARASILAEVKRDGYELTEQELATEVAIRLERVVDNNYNMYDPKLKSINNQQEYNIKVTSKLNAQEADIAIQIRQLTNSLGTMVNALPENLSHKKDWTPLAMKQSIKYAIDNNLNYLVLPIEKHSIQQIEQWGDREPAVLTAILDRNSIYSPRAYRDIVKKWDKDAKPFNDEYLDRDERGDWTEADIHKVIVLPITDAIRAGYKKDGLTAYRRGGLVTQMKALIPNG